MKNNDIHHFTEHPIEWDNEKISRLWNFYSKTPPYSDVYFSKVFGHQILKQSSLNLENPLDVVDFGCGPGFIWTHLNNLNSNWRYTGLDFSADSVNKLLSIADNNKLFQGAHHIDALPSLLPSERYDVVLLFEVIEHLNSQQLRSTISEISRLLKKGGVVVITTPNEEDLSKSRRFCPECGAIFHAWQHVRSWSAQDLTEYMSQNGFLLRHVKTLDFAAQGFNTTAWFKKIKRCLLTLVNKKPALPHLIGVYQKQHSPYSG